MKNNILKICAFLILVSCNETLEEPSIKKEKLKVLNEQATTNHKKNINGRTPGDGSGEPGSGSYGSG